MSDQDIHHQATVAAEAVAQMTQIEVNLWMKQIERLGPAKVLSFIEFWMSGGAQGSYRRVPTIEDLLKHTDSEFVGTEQALELLRRYVADCGPWNDPPINDAKLKEAVVHMGGWAKVCHDMPDPSEDFAYKRFGERFRVAWSRSEALMVQKTLAPAPLLGLFSEPSQLKIGLADAGAADTPLPLAPPSP